MKFDEYFEKEKKMVLQKFPSSFQMTAKKVGKYEFDWQNLKIGESWQIPVQVIGFANLQSRASKAGKKLDCVFKVIKHENVYEVGRVSNVRKKNKNKTVVEKQQSNVDKPVSWDQVKLVDK